MTRENTMFGLIGLLLGVIIAGFVAGQAVNNNNTSMMRMMGMNTEQEQTDTVTDHNTMSMAEMSQQLEGLSGDDFDKAFVEMMIAHHEGAIDMAELIPSRAKHDEIKILGKAIIAAQTKEINDMRVWQGLWGYQPDEATEMMHGNH